MGCVILLTWSFDLDSRAILEKLHTFNTHIYSRLFTQRTGRKFSQEFWLPLWNNVSVFPNKAWSSEAQSQYHYFKTKLSAGGWSYCEPLHLCWFCHALPLSSPTVVSPYSPTQSLFLQIVSIEASVCVPYTKDIILKSTASYIGAVLMMLYYVVTGKMLGMQFGKLGLLYMVTAHFRLPHICICSAQFRNLCDLRITPRTVPVPWEYCLFCISNSSCLSCKHLTWELQSTSQGSLFKDLVLRAISFQLVALLWKTAHRSLGNFNNLYILSISNLCQHFEYSIFLCDLETTCKVNKK